ncbi:MAG: cysteine-rich repeat protein, partial [Myxococcota bacterium]
MADFSSQGDFAGASGVIYKITAIPGAHCGDGIVTGRETCDERATATGGCSESCNTVPGWKCPGDGSPCVPSLTPDPILWHQPLAGHGRTDTGPSAAMTVKHQLRGTRACTRGPR